MILGLLPLKLSDREAYAQVVGGLLPRRGLERWMTGVRVVLRDERRARFIIPQLELDRMPRVLVYDNLDLSPAAIARALESDARDPSVPTAERMLAVMQLAAIDFSHRRYAESYRKWGLLFNQYEQAGSAEMQALCLCGGADVLRRMGRLEEAKIAYRQGLAVAQCKEALAPALNLLIGISEICMERQEWLEAAGYLDLADQVASKTHQAVPKCDIMDRHGVALLAVGRTAGARAKWRASADLSREMQHYDRCESALGHLIVLFERAGMPEDLAAHRRELDEVRRERWTAQTHRSCA